MGIGVNLGAQISGCVVSMELGDYFLVENNLGLETYATLHFCPNGFFSATDLL